MNENTANQPSDTGTCSGAGGDVQSPRSWRIRLADWLVATGEKLLAEPPPANAAAVARLPQDDVPGVHVEGLVAPVHVARKTPGQ